MESLDTTMDPIHTLVRDFLRDEGSIQVAPLPEIKDSSVEMIPLASERRLKRLQKLWMRWMYRCVRKLSQSTVCRFFPVMALNSTFGGIDLETNAYSQ